MRGISSTMILHACSSNMIKKCLGQLLTKECYHTLATTVDLCAMAIDIFKTTLVIKRYNGNIRVNVHEKRDEKQAIIKTNRNHSHVSIFDIGKKKPTIWSVSNKLKENALHSEDGAKKRAKKSRLRKLATSARKLEYEH